MQIIGIVVFLILILLLSYWKRRINIKLIHNNRSFRVKGHKDSFTISIDKRFTFRVVNGQIVSVSDKLASQKTIYYGGGSCGNHQ